MAEGSARPESPGKRSVAPYDQTRRHFMTDEFHLITDDIHSMTEPIAFDGWSASTNNNEKRLQQLWCGYH
jgi:hypothetical protein